MCPLELLHYPASSAFQWTEHVNFIKLERGEYWARRSKGVDEENDVLSIIIDGQDQSATALPAYSEVKKNDQCT